MNKRTFFPKPHARSHSKDLVQSVQELRGALRRTELTRPKDLVSRVQPPRNLRMMKPPKTVLISGIPLCFAYGAYSCTSNDAHDANVT